MQLEMGDEKEEKHIYKQVVKGTSAIKEWNNPSYKQGQRYFRIFYTIAWDDK